MPATYQLIASNTLSSAAASVTFSAIPGTYTDLVLRVSARTTRTALSDSIKITVNSDNSSLYSFTQIYGYGSSAASLNASGQSTLSGGAINGANSTSNTFASVELYIPSYTVSQNKPMSVFDVWENNSSTDNQVSARADLYRSTTAISSLLLESVFGTNFVSGSSFFLYGIKNS